MKTKKKIPKKKNSTGTKAPVRKKKVKKHAKKYHKPDRELGEVVNRFGLSLSSEYVGDKILPKVKKKAKKVAPQKQHPKSRKGAGRPTKYKPKYCQMIIDFMGRGYSIEAFAGEIHVNKDTIYQWIKFHEEFSDAKKEGEARSLKFWEGLGIDLATGTNQKGNVTAWIFNIKNRENWRDKHDISNADGTLAPKVHIYLPDNGRARKK